ncbi:general stress protein [Paenibacillus tritici]|uniref:General stress protein n=1 Tax=Paenibacillus tritici TaxID=1873425 RepID=A0ABX2DKB5_9BACL|nr:general stress protein [Paenibacillus tritici]NQX45054.1 general stress protein [Paenibacillus tritici]QUL53097.1 general stress protein [Paenibacillus tritici]
MPTLVLGIFGHRSDAALAIEELKENGMKAKHISAVTKQKNTLEIISHDTGIGAAQTGLGNGGLFGTARGLGVGLDMVADSAVAAGPAARKLAGAELETDSLAVSLIGIGIPQEDAEAYARHANLEHIIVIVLLSDEELRESVEVIFAKHNVIPLGSD